MRTRASRENKIREASGHVMIDAVAAPEDSSGPCRSVIHQYGHLAPTSQKGHYLSVKRVRHPLSSTSVGREVGEAWIS